MGDEGRGEGGAIGDGRWEGGNLREGNFGEGGGRRRVRSGRRRDGWRWGIERRRGQRGGRNQGGDADRGQEGDSEVVGVGDWGAGWQDIHEYPAPQLRSSAHASASSLAPRRILD